MPVLEDGGLLGVPSDRGVRGDHVIGEGGRRAHTYDVGLSSILLTLALVAFSLVGVQVVESGR